MLRMIEKLSAKCPHTELQYSGGIDLSYVEIGIESLLDEQVHNLVRSGANVSGADTPVRLIAKRKQDLPLIGR